MNEQLYSPILLTAIQRSGSSLIAKILHLAGAYKGPSNNMYENTALSVLTKEYIRDNTITSPYPKFEVLPIDWQTQVADVLKKEGYAGVKPWFFKHAIITQTWKLWNYAFPNAKWIIVRRRSGDIINSCSKTSYMTLFKDKETQRMVGVDSEKEGWKWWIHQYEDAWVEMISAGLNCKVIWPERMAVGDYAQIYEMIEWLGLEWSREIFNEIDPLINKQRKV